MFLISPAGIDYDIKQKYLFNRTYINMLAFEEQMYWYHHSAVDMIAMKQKQKGLRSWQDDEESDDESRPHVVYSAHEKEVKSLVRKSTAMIHFQIKNTPGYAAALVNTLKNFSFRDLHELYMAVGKDPRPVFIVLGAGDVISGQSSSDDWSELFPEASEDDERVKCYAHCGHNVLFDNYHLVAKDILAFHKEVVSFAEDSEGSEGSGNSDDEEEVSGDSDDEEDEDS